MRPSPDTAGWIARLEKQGSGTRKKTQGFNRASFLDHRRREVWTKGGQGAGRGQSVGSDNHCRAGKNSLQANQQQKGLSDGLHGRDSIS